MEAYLAIAFWLVYVFVVVILTETFAYVWHRFGAHTDYLPGIGETHAIHHNSSLRHEADEDFIWILLVFSLAEIFAGVVVMLRLVPGSIVLVGTAVSFSVFVWNWWIHRAYHCENHWLNGSEWFQKERQRHFLHHDFPDKNYGIASHFSDRFLGSFKEVTH